MSMLLNDYLIGPTGRKGWVRLAAPLVYVDYRGRKWEVPPGFESDGASIPRMVWHVIGHPLGEYLSAAILHDYLYSEHGTSRQDADRIFLDAMRDLGVAKWKRSVMWAAVRVGGWACWESIWLLMLVACLVALTVACKSTVIEERDGKRWSVETRSVCGLELHRTEMPVPSVWEQRRAAVTAMAPRGGWLITIGAVIGGVCLALAIYSQSILVDRVAMAGAAIGGGFVGAGVFLLGMSFLVALLPFALIAGVLIGIIKYRKGRDHGRRAQ